MIRKVALLPLLCVLAGCDGYSAVWLIDIGDIVAADPTLDIEHNFMNATPEADEATDEWTEEQVTAASHALQFAEIFEVDGGDAGERVMVASGTTLLGTKNDDGLWVFQWTNFENQDSTESHVSGYQFAVGQDSTLVWMVTLDLEAKETTGTFDLAVLQTATFTETDVWSTSETGRMWGEIPAEEYLDSTNEGEFVLNVADTTDCTGTPCTLTVSVGLSASAPVVAYRTNMDPDGFEGIEGSGQEAGIPEDLFTR